MNVQFLLYGNGYSTIVITIFLSLFIFSSRQKHKNKNKKQKKTLMWIAHFVNSHVLFSLDFSFRSTPLFLSVVVGKKTKQDDEDRPLIKVSFAQISIITFCCSCYFFFRSFYLRDISGKRMWFPFFSFAMALDISASISAFFDARLSAKILHLE